MVKMRLPILGMLLLVMMTELLGCGGTPAPPSTQTDITGSYVNRDNPKEFLEFDADGTFLGRERDASFHGSWRLRGDEVILMLPIGIAATAKVVGNTIVDSDSKTWVKQKQIAESPRGSKPATRPALVGSYERTDSPKEYLELRANGTVLVTLWDGTRVSGTWSVENDTLVLTRTDGGTTESERLQNKGGTLIMSNGVTFLKK